MKKAKGAAISKLRYLLAGITILTTAFVVGMSVDVMNSQLMKNLSSHVDSFDSVLISDSQTPLADQEVQTSTNTSSQTVKLKKKSKKTYTKALPDQTSSRTTAREEEGNLVVTNTTTKTVTTEQYTKKKKTKVVTSTVTTTKIITKYPIEGSANEDVQTSTSASSQTVKLKKKSKKTYSKSLPDTVTTDTKVTAEGNTLVQTDTVVQTQTTEQYTKKKKTKVVTYNVTTTVITSKYAMKHTEPESATGSQAEQGTAAAQPESKPESKPEAEPEAQPEEAATAEDGETAAADETEGEATDAGTGYSTPAPESQPAEPAQPEETPEAVESQPADTPSNDTAPALPEGTSAIRTAAPKADSNLLSAFDKLGFTFKVDSGNSYTGLFDARNRYIILRYNDDNVYHELGHFLAFASRNYDCSAEFSEIYKAEKGLYKGRNSAYVLRDESEYFAESYRNYVLDKEALKAERPLTYGAIEKALGTVNDAQVEKLKRLYAAIWNK